MDIGGSRKGGVESVPEISPAVHVPHRNMYDMIEQPVAFEITPSGSLTSPDGRLGVVSPLLPWNIAKEIP